MITLWLFYLLALGAALAAAWSWFPKSRLWLWLLSLVALVFAVPWRVNPAVEDSGLAPAIVVTLFAAAFEPQTAAESGWAIIWWLVAFLTATLAWHGLRFWRAFRRVRAARAAARQLELEDALLEEDEDESAQD